MSDTTTLIEAYGKAITPKELAIFLSVDPRTVTKYADTWGGVEVSPGKIRFFENIVRRKINAQFNNKERQEEMESEYNGEWQKERQAVSKRLDHSKTQRNNLGKGGKRKTGKRADRHGLLDNT